MVFNKKTPDDYIEEESPNCITITSLAYLLTADGLNNPIVAEILRDSIESSTDEGFSEAFDGATKEEARLHLLQWDLCYMPYWGHEELAKCLCSETCRDKELVLSSIKLAQKVKELPKVFTPNQGILWAMEKGYLVANTVCHWVNVDCGRYGHPHNTLNDKTELEENSTQEYTGTKRLDSLNHHMYILEQTAKTKGITFDKKRLPCSKKMMLEWLQSKKHKPHDLFVIELPTFETFWSKVAKGYRCAPPASVDKDFFKKIQE